MFKRAFRLVCTGLILVMITASLFVVNGAGGKEVTLTFWNGFTGSDGEILKDIVNRFNQKENGKIKIKMDIMPWDVFYQKLPPAIATKTAPSFILLDPVNMPQYVANGSIQPVNDFWSKTGLKEKDYLQNVLDSMKYKGKYYEMPMNTFLIYLYWNKDLFKAAGLNPEKPPQTMDEMASFAVKLTDPAKNQFGLGLPVKGGTNYWTSFIWNNGGEIFDAKKKKSLLNSPQNIKTLEWVRELANKKVTPMGASGPDIDNLLISGQLGMYINGPWLVNGLRKNNINFGIAAPPKGSVRQQVVSGGMGFAIPSCTKAAEKKAIYEFIKYWMSSEILKEWSMKNGFPAWSAAVMNDPEIKADPVLGAITPLGVLGRNETQGFQGISAIDNDVMWPMMEAVIVGAEKPAEAVKKASEKIDGILKSYK